MSVCVCLMCMYLRYSSLSVCLSCGQHTAVQNSLLSFHSIFFLLHRIHYSLYVCCDIFYSDTCVLCTLYVCLSPYMEPFSMLNTLIYYNGVIVRLICLCVCKNVSFVTFNSRCPWITKGEREREREKSSNARRWRAILKKNPNFDSSIYNFWSIICKITVYNLVIFATANDNRMVVLVVVSSRQKWCQFIYENIFIRYAPKFNSSDDKTNTFYDMLIKRLAVSKFHVNEIWMGKLRGFNSHHSTRRLSLVNNGPVDFNSQIVKSAENSTLQPHLLLKEAWPLIHQMHLNWSLAKANYTLHSPVDVCQ